MDVMFTFGLIVNFVILSNHTSNSSNSCLKFQIVTVSVEDSFGVDFNRHLCYLIVVSSCISYLSTIALWLCLPGTLTFRPIVHVLPYWWPCCC